MIANSATADRRVAAVTISKDCINASPILACLGEVHSSGSGQCKRPRHEAARSDDTKRDRAATAAASVARRTAFLGGGFDGERQTQFGFANDVFDQFLAAGVGNLAGHKAFLRQPG